MKHLIKIRIVLLFSAILTSCYKNKTIIYHSSNFNKGQSILIDIDEGSFIYKKKFNHIFSKDEYTLVKKYSSDKDSLKILFKVDDRDSIFFIPNTSEKILLLYGEDEKLYMYDENDTKIWINW